MNFQVFAQDKISDYEMLLHKTFDEVIQIEKIKNKKMQLDKKATRSEMIKATCQVKDLSLRQVAIIDKLFNYPKVENETYQKETQLREVRVTIKETLMTLNQDYYKGRLEETCRREG
jgi:hypothetical protein